MSQLFRKQVDNMMDAHVGWHEACRLVNDAYSSWSSATGLRARVAFLRYMAALDAEERAAGIYAGTVRRVGRLVMSGNEPGRPLGAPPRRHAFAGSFLGRRESWRAAGRDARALYKHGIVADLLVGTDRACGGRPPRATLDAAI